MRHLAMYRQPIPFGKGSRSGELLVLCTPSEGLRPYDDSCFYPMG